MKHFNTLRLPALAIFSLVLLISSCKKDDTTPEGNFTLDIKALVNGDPLVMEDSVYKNILDYNYKIETLRFYLSNLSLIKSDNTEVMVKDVSYLDFTAHHSTYTSEGEQITATVPAGDYKGIKFAIGVDSSVNNSDPTVYPNDHPLSIYRNAHWNWNTGYIFLKLEGKIDSIPNGNKSLTQGFVYHCGTNPLYRERTFTRDFSVTDGGSFQYNLVLNVDKLFYSDTDTLDVRHDNVSHSENDLLPLAERVTNLFVNALDNRQ